MKLLILWSLIISNLYAQSDFDIFAGYEDGVYKNAKVSSSALLKTTKSILERRYDFHENVSYTGEDWANVEIYCGYNSQQSEYSYENSMLEAVTDWNQIKDSKGNTVGYILYLFAKLEFDCNYPRGIYVVNLRGEEILDDNLYKEFGIYWDYFLTNTYLK